MCIRQDDEAPDKAFPELVDGNIKLGPNLKLNLAMYLVEDLFLSQNEDVLLRVRIEIKQHSDSFDKIASLKVLTNATGQRFENTHSYTVYGKTQVIDFGFRKSMVAINTRGDQTNGESSIIVVYDDETGEANGDQCIIIKNIMVYTQKIVSEPLPALCEAKKNKNGYFVCEKL